MKKQKKVKWIIMILMSVVIIWMIADLRTDDKSADLIYIASNGRTGAYLSYNGKNGKKLALENKVTINLKKGETVFIKFQCRACGNKQKFNIDKNWTKLISCDCLERIDKNNNSKEYVAVVVKYSE